MCEALATNAIWFNVKFTIDFILLHTASPFPYPGSPACGISI